MGRVVTKVSSISAKRKETWIWFACQVLFLAIFFDNSWRTFNASSYISSPMKLLEHCFQNRTGPGGRTVKTGNRDENRFFKPKEPDFLLIPWTAKTGVRLHESVRTVRSNPLAIFFLFFFLKKQLNTILFYLIKLSISYKE